MLSGNAVIVLSLLWETVRYGSNLRRAILTGAFAPAKLLQKYRLCNRLFDGRKSCNYPETIEWDGQDLAVFPSSINLGGEGLWLLEHQGFRYRANVRSPCNG